MEDILILMVMGVMVVMAVMLPMVANQKNLVTLMAVRNVLVMEDMVKRNQVTEATEDTVVTEDMIMHQKPLRKNNQSSRMLKKEVKNLN